LLRKRVFYLCQPEPGLPERGVEQIKKMHLVHFEF